MQHTCKKWFHALDLCFALQAYVQQLETSRLKLIQIEQELDRARQQV
jgi:hypothetical protein